MAKLESASTTETVEAERRTFSKWVSSKLPAWAKLGWKTTVGLGFFAATFVFILNLVLLVWTLAASHGFVSDYLSEHPGDQAKGIRTVYTGNCEAAAAISTWAHLAINILSSLLLAASNSAMQVLVAPSRQEVNEAHAQRRWLDIGVQSWRNLRSITFSRRLIWILLAVTTVPLHLL